MSAEQEPDFRGKRAKIVRIDPDWDWDDNDLRGRVGQEGRLESIYLDGRPCHSESYLIHFDDGHIGAVLAEEVELV